MRLIDADGIYKEIIQAEDRAMDRVVSTNETIDDRVNPLFIRYSAQLDERTMFKHMVADAPVIDAVSVVRCKDCKYYCGVCTNDYVNNSLEPLGLDGGAEFMPDEDFYCKEGERKKE